MTAPDFDLDALIARANAGRRGARARIDDERVAGELDARVVRYYQSLGLLDRPLRYDGRRAIYGPRHLLQFRAVKALQSRGHPLSMIQESLAGRTDEQLEQIAGGRSDGSEGGVAAERLATPTVPLADPRSAPRSLSTFELAPGIHVTIDPARFPDPRALARHLSESLSSHHTSPPPSNRGPA